MAPTDTAKPIGWEADTKTVEGYKSSGRALPDWSAFGACLSISTFEGISFFALTSPFNANCIMIAIDLQWLIADTLMTSH